MIAIILSLAPEAALDPFFSWLGRGWGDVGGWSLFIGLCLLIVVGAFRDMWVPGSRHRKMEALVEKQAETIQALTMQNGQLVTANEISKYFFEETVPKRGEPKE